MALYERLMGLQEPKLSVHDMSAVFAEIFRGKTTAAVAYAYYGLDASEQAEATTLYSAVNGGNSALGTGTQLADRERRIATVEGVLILAEAGYPDFDTVAKVKARFGV